MRLVVRRVAPTPGSQLALFTAWDYHAFITDRDLPLAQVEADHRRHAIVEQTIAELKSAGLAHLPSGKFMANAAWLALAVMAHNLGRAIGHLAGPELDKATTATLRPSIWIQPRAKSAVPVKTLGAVIVMVIWIPPGVWTSFGEVDLLRVLTRTVSGLHHRATGPYQ